MLQVDKVYIIHTKTGLEYRKKHIVDMMAQHDIDFEFMLEGDVSDLSLDILEKYFVNNHMRQATARTSCALKHIFVLEKVVNTPLNSVLIFEDDVILHKNFTDLFNRSQKEAKDNGEINEDFIYIDYDNSTLEHPPHSKLKRNKILYKQSKTRGGGGGYYLTFKVAQKFINHIKKNKCHTSNDLFWNDLFKTCQIPAYWCHPALIEQASNNGMWESSLGNQAHGLWRRISWRTLKLLKNNCFYRIFRG